MTKPRFLSITLLFTAFAGPSCYALGKIYWYNGNYTYGFFVPAICIYTGFVILKSRTSTLSPALIPGMFLTSVGGFVVIIALWYNIALLPYESTGMGFLSAAGVILTIYGLTLIYGGFPLFATLTFPLFFLWFAAPLPGSVFNILTLSLKTIVSVMSEILLRIIQIPVFREGNLLNLETASLGIADACSGIRSLNVMAAASAGLAYLMNTGVFRGTILFLLSPLITVGGNLFRVTLTGVLVQHLGPEYAGGFRHETVGMISLLLPLAIIIGLSRIMSRPSPRTEEPLRNNPSLSFPNISNPGLMLTALILILGITAQFAIHRHYNAFLEPATHRKPLKELPEQIEEFVQIRKDDLPRGQFKVLRPSDQTIRIFQTPDDKIVTFWIFWWEPAMSCALQSHTPDICYPASGWQRISRFDFADIIFGIPADPAYIRLFSKPQGQKMVLSWHRGNKRLIPPKGILPKIRHLIKTWNNPDTDRNSRFIVTMETDVKTSPENARNLLIRFARSLGPLLKEYGL